MAIPAPLIRTPRPYSVGDDFALWIRRFEAYTRAVRIPDDKLSDALLALLDDAAFRAFDLLGLPEETVKDYKQLVDALKKRFAPGAGQQELRFLLGQRVQEAGETLDGFADALIHLANRAYPAMESKLRMELARDRFVAGVQEEYIQEALLRSPPETLDQARETAKCAEAAQAARRRMRPKKTRVYVRQAVKARIRRRLKARILYRAKLLQSETLGKSWRKQSAATQKCWNDFFPRCKCPAPVARTAGELGGDDPLHVGGVASSATFNAIVRETRSGRRLGSIGGREPNNRSQIAPSPNCQYSDSAGSFYGWESRRSTRINPG